MFRRPSVRARRRLPSPRLRRVALLAPCVVVLGLSACAVGEPLQTTNIGDTGATLHGNVYSSFAGDTTYWFVYGEDTSYAGGETPHNTIAIADDQPHPVSEPVSGLTPDTTYHFVMCAQDEEEDPPRTNCSTDRTFTTAPPGDGSLIAFTSTLSGDPQTQIHSMDTFGNNQTNLSDVPTSSHQNAAWSPDGSQIAYSRDGQIHVMDADGDNQTNISNNSGSDYDPAWSPDGDQIAFSSDIGSTTQVYVMDADGDNQTNISDNSEFDYDPTWSPDGDQIAFTSLRDSTPGFGRSEIYVMNADGSIQTRVTTTENEDQAAWSPDGSQIAFSSIRDGNWEIYAMDADGDNQTNLTNDPEADVQAAWSPDGSRIAFSSLRDVQDSAEIYVMDADGGSQTNLTNNLADDRAPSWSPVP